MFGAVILWVAKKLTAGLVLSLCCIGMLLLMSLQPVLAEPGATSEMDGQQPDSAEAWPEKRDGKDTWEKVVSFPGTVIYLPLDLIFEAHKAVIGFFYDRRATLKVKRSRGVLPTYADRTGGGVHVFQKDLFSSKSRLTLSLMAGLEQRQTYQLKLEDISLFGDALSSDFLVRYQMLSTEFFFGIGPESREEDESGFAHRQMTAETAHHIGFGDQISLGVIAGLDLNEILDSKDEDDPVITERDLPGLTEQVEMGRLQIVVSRDSRDRPANPSGGSKASLTAGLFQDFDDDFRFWQLSADLRYYLHPFYNRILSLRLAGEFNRELADREIPFYYLSELGRQETIRGFSRGRFRGRDMILASVEYHYPVWRMVNAVLFIDVGQVADDVFDDLSRDHFEFGYGGGIQVWGRDRLTMAFFVGKSRDELRFYFNLN